MKRRQFLSCAPIAAAVVLTGCGGGSDAAPTPSTGQSRSPAPAPLPVTMPPSSPIPTLLVQPTRSGTLPYFAAVYPLPGAVPATQAIVSQDDSSLRGSVLSRWPDGSAAVVVVAGVTALSNGTPKVIRLTAGSASSTPLTAARIGQLVNNVTVDCGSVGTASISSFGAPQKVWWANDRVICCRYRAPIGSHPTLEAVIDIHGFSSNHAFVEVVVENAKVNMTSPAVPASVSYSATVSVNGTAVASTSTASAPTGTHQGFRAWYASYWVGGDPGIDVTQDAPSMQMHPLLFRTWKPGGSMSEYASDAYSPWSTGRQRATNMGGTGDHPSIGPLPQWEVQYLQTGDRQAQRAVLASALATLTFNVNYRDAATGLVPTFPAIGTRDIAGVGDWPSIKDDPAWEQAHHPAAGLMAFMSRPSPVFIEIAQKIATWNKASGWSPKGTFGDYYQTRGKAWCFRSHAHALFITPDGEAWKAAAQTVLYEGVLTIKAFKDDPKSVLGFVWDWSPNNVYDHDAAVAGFQQAVWEHHYLLVELHKVANALLLSGAQQATLVEVANWAAAQPVRYVNEARGGEWRILYYKTTLGRDGTTIDSLPTYGDQFAWQYGNTPPPVSGPWMLGDYTSSSYSSARVQKDLGGAYYDSYFWSALVAAVERGVPGADAAWTKVVNNVTTLAAWSEGFKVDPRWGTYPRNR